MNSSEALTVRRTPAIDNYDRLPAISRLALSVERSVESDDLFVAVKADADNGGYQIARPYPQTCPKCRGTGGGVYNDCSYCDSNGDV